MRRYWIPSQSFLGPLVELKDDVYHHIVVVCRQELGAKFEVLGDGDQAHLVEIIELSKKKATAKILESRTLPILKKPHIVLALSVPKFPVMESVVEKAVEMGVHRIQPFFSEFSFVRRKSSLPDSKLERWKKIVVSASQQSGRGELLQVSDVCDFLDLAKIFNRNEKKMGLFSYEGQSTLSIKNFLSSPGSVNRENLEEVWLFVGSEGGFSVSEVQSFQKWGLDPVTLGDQVLRVETACITLVSILKYEFGLY